MFINLVFASKFIRFTRNGNITQAHIFMVKKMMLKSKDINSPTDYVDRNLKLTTVENVDSRTISIKYLMAVFINKKFYSF